MLMHPGQNYAPLGSPNTLDRLVDEVASGRGSGVYLLRNVDLFGLQKHIGGPGAYDTKIATILQNL